MVAAAECTNLMENRYSGATNNRANYLTDSAGGRWLSPIEDFLAAELAGIADAEADSVPDSGAASRRLAEAQSGSVYRSRAGSPKAENSGDCNNSGSRPAG